VVDCVAVLLAALGSLVVQLTAAVLVMVPEAAGAVTSMVTSIVSPMFISPMSQVTTPARLAQDPWWCWPPGKRPRQEEYPSGAHPLRVGSVVGDAQCVMQGVAGQDRIRAVVLGQRQVRIKGTRYSSAPMSTVAVVSPSPSMILASPRSPLWAETTPRSDPCRCTENRLKVKVRGQKRRLVDVAALGEVSSVHEIGRVGLKSLWWRRTVDPSPSP